MDYSALPSDPDHPDGTSPWQTSPGPVKSDFNPSGQSSGPPSPTPQPTTPSIETPTTNETPSEPPTSEPQLRNDINSPDQEAFSPPLEEDFPSQSGPPPRRSNISNVPDIRFQGPPMTEEELRQQQLQQQRQQERYKQALNAQHSSRGPNRYHQTGRGGGKPPQYRLQAKIVGLERTGKKDPSIRFDVHVRVERVTLNCTANTTGRPTYLNFARPKCAISSAPILSLSNWQII